MFLCEVENGLALGGLLVEGLRAAAEGDVRAGIDDLLGDGALSAFLLQVITALLGVLGAVALAGCDVSGLDGGGRVLDLGGGDVARGLASLPDRCPDSDGRAAGSSYDGCPGGGRTKGTKKMLDRRKSAPSIR